MPPNTLAVRRSLSRATQAAVIFYAFCCGNSAFSEDYLFEREPGRYALVIGNSNYQHIGAIPSATLDAQTVARHLRELNFKVTEPGEVASVQAFEDQILPAFRTPIEPGDLVVFYFSGHGFSYGSNNFLAPTELPVQLRDKDLPNQAIATESVEMYFARRSPGLVLLIIDACRTIGGFVVNDAQKQGLIAKGIADPTQPEAGINTMVAYASRPGFAAYGYSGANQLSAFTSSLVQHISQEGREFGNVMKDVEAEVWIQSNQTQQPGVFAWSGADLYMRPSAENLVDQKQTWQNMLNSRVYQNIELYSIRYSLSRYAAAARKWMADNPPAQTNPPFSRISPEAVERAWVTDESRKAIVPASAGFAFTRSLGGTASDAVDALKDGQLGLVPSGSKQSKRQSLASDADTLAAHSQVVSLRDYSARTLPSATAPLASQIPAGSLVTVDGVEFGDHDKVWLRVSVPGIADAVYLPVQHFGSTAPVELGRSLAEIVVPPRDSGNRDLLDGSSITSTVTRLKDEGVTITWVSIATAVTKESEEVAARAMRRSDAEDILKRSGIDGTRITAVADADDFSGEGVRLRFFGYKKR